MKNKQYPLYEWKKLNNLRELVNFSANKYKNNIAYTYRDNNDQIIEVTFQQFKKDVINLGNYLLNNGIKNKHISLCSENSYQWIVTYFAVVNTGNVIVPIDKELTAEEVMEIIIDSDSSILFYSENMADKVNKFAKDTPKLKLKLELSKLDKYINEGAIFTKNANKYQTLKLNNEKMCSLLFTSGTTGKPKGVMLSHKSIMAATVNSCKNVRFSTRTLLVLPLHHSFGFTGAIAMMLMQGDNVVINRGLKEFAKDMKEFKPVNMLLVPLFIESLKNQILLGAKKQGKEASLQKAMKLSLFLYKMGIDIRRKIFKSVLDNFGGELKFVISGAAPLEPSLIEFFRAIGIDVRQGYGVTECSPVIAVCRNNYYRDTSIGLPIPGVKTKIVNPDENGFGDLHVKGAIVMLGYYKNKKATSKVINDGWFNTEDICKIDQDGFLYINGRHKNLIILSNGKNVSAEELELKINKLEGVKEVIVVGDSQKDNKVIIAKIFPDYDKYKNIKLAEKDLTQKINNLNEELAIYKRIQKIEIMTKEFPKTTTKKIKR